MIVETIYLVKKEDWSKFVKKFNDKYAWEDSEYLKDYNPFFGEYCDGKAEEIYVNVENYPFAYGTKFYRMKGIWIRKTNDNRQALLQCHTVITDWCTVKESIE